MIGDWRGVIGKKYGVVWPILGLDRRVTFVIDRAGVVRRVFASELDPTGHVDDALAILRSMQ
jgi:peroxiredoxin Q/BCP